MWVGTHAALRLSVIGAGLVAAGLHGASAHPRTGSATAASVGAVTTYQPPAVRITAEPHTQPRVLPTRAAVTNKPRPRRSPSRVAAPARRATIIRPATRPSTRPATQQSFADALAAAVARIPTYRAGASRWVVSTAYDFWGTADWYHDVLYVNPDVPRSKLYDVAVHEWSHELSVLDYAGDVAAATKAMNAWFGGSGLVGPERAADCMAILQGATWTHYTTCDNSTWRAGAARLVAGKQL